MIEELLKQILNDVRDIKAFLFGEPPRPKTPEEEYEEALHAFLRGDSKKLNDYFAKRKGK